MIPPAASLHDSKARPLPLSNSASSRFSNGGVPQLVPNGTAAMSGLSGYSQVQCRASMAMASAPTLGMAHTLTAPVTVQMPAASPVHGGSVGVPVGMLTNPGAVDLMPRHNTDGTVLSAGVHSRLGHMQSSSTALRPGGSATLAPGIQPTVSMSSSDIPRQSLNPCSPRQLQPFRQAQPRPFSPTVLARALPSDSNGSLPASPQSRHAVRIPQGVDVRQIAASSSIAKRLSDCPPPELATRPSASVFPDVRPIEFKSPDSLTWDPPKEAVKDAEVDFPLRSMDGIARFLDSTYTGPRDAITTCVSVASSALGVSVYYYSSPRGPGTGKHVERWGRPEEDHVTNTDTVHGHQTISRTDKASNFVLVSSTDLRCTSGEPPLELFTDVLEEVLSRPAPTSCDGVQDRFPARQCSPEDRQLCAAAVRNDDAAIVGLLLLARSNSASPREALSVDALNSAASTWASVLAGRLERIRQRELLMENSKRADVWALGAQMAKETSIAGIVELTQGPMTDALSCEVVTLFFIDDAQEQIWSPPRPELPDGLTVSCEDGFVGHVFSRAQETKDFQQSVLITNDPHSCPYWMGDQDPGFSTRCLMCAPMMKPDGSLLGLIECINKKPQSCLHRTGEVEDDNFFHLGDLRLIEVLCEIVGRELQRLLIDRIVTKADMDMHNNDDPSGHRTSLVSEYYETRRGGRDVRASFVDDDGMDIIKFKTGKMETIISESEIGNDADADEWEVDYWALDEMAEFRLVVQCLARFHAFNFLQISKQKFFQFFTTVRSGYKENPYHNFQHAIATVHYSYVLLESADHSDSLGKGETFALIVGALCHDLGHRGYNTAFEVTSRSELALRYNDMSPLENHHCARVFEIAFTADQECNIFQNLSNEVYTAMRHYIVAGILGTDMKCHAEHVKKAHTLESDQNSYTKEDLVSLFMHSADIANPCMPPPISARWAALLAEEFTLQVSAERQLGLPVTAFMDGLTDQVGRAKSNLGFIDFVFHPLYDPLFRLFPGWSEPRDNLKINRQASADTIADAKKDEGSTSPTAASPA